MENNPLPLTVIVPTGNRLDTIEDCLKSVRWASEVIVVDSFSTDGTYDIARQYADKVLRHEYGYSALQKNWAIPQAANEWVLIVDTDERVTCSLKEEVKELLRNPGEHVGYKIPRENFLLGKAIHHAGYYPDYQIRLFKRDCGRYELRRVHAHVQLDGTCGVIRSPLYHYAHRSLNQTMDNLLILMTGWEAEQRRLKNTDGNRSKLRLWMNLLARPAGAFGLRYFKEGGWRDGTHGLVASLLWSMYVAITYMKIWEQDLALPANWWEEDWGKDPENDSSEAQYSLRS